MEWDGVAYYTRRRCTWIIVIVRREDQAALERGRYRGGALTVTRDYNTIAQIRVSSTPITWLGNVAWI
jgi:hypothetical protein